MGKALHPVMDSTSPAHAGFQQWEGPGLAGQRLALHGLRESMISEANMKASIAAVRAEFVKVFGGGLLQLAIAR